MHQLMNNIFGMYKAVFLLYNTFSIKNEDLVEKLVNSIILILTLINSNLMIQNGYCSLMNHGLTVLDYLLNKYKLILKIRYRI